MAGSALSRDLKGLAMPVEPRFNAASGAIVWTRRLRVMRAGAMFAAWLTSIWIVSAGLALGADLQLVQVKETSPGSIVATVRTADTQPPATAFHLHFPNSLTKDVVANQVTPVANPSATQATAVIVGVDRSGSMRLAVPAIKQALTEAFAVPRPDLQIAVLPFGSTIPEPQPFMSNQAAVASAISGVEAERGKDGKTLLYDTVNRALNRLRDQSQGGGRLLIISDGKDEGSQLTLQSLLTEAKARGIPIDTVGFGPEARGYSMSLQDMSAASAGKFVLAGDGDQLADAVRSDLGVKPVPTFNLHFQYVPNTSAGPDASVQLRYAVAGAAPVSVPVNLALPMPAAAPARAAVQPSTPASNPPAPEGSTLDKFIKLLSGSSPIAKINIGTFSAVILAVVAALIWLATYLLRPTRPDPLPAPTPTPVPSPRPMRAGTQIGAFFAAPARGRPSAQLIGRSGAWRGKQFAIEHTLVHVGADATNDLSIAGDEYVSGKHATIRFEGGSLYINDLSSTNGTFLNGTRLRSTAGVLTPGDEIRFGRTSFELRSVSEGASRRSEDRHRVP